MEPIVPIATIQREARAAAQSGQSLNDACPYPFFTEAGKRFKAEYRHAKQELVGQPISAKAMT